MPLMYPMNVVSARFTALSWICNYSQAREMTTKQMSRKGHSFQRGILTPRLGDVSDIHLHTPPLIASEAAIAGGVDHQSYMAAVVLDDVSKNLAFEEFNSDLA